MYLVDHHTFLGVYLMLGKCRARCKFEQKGCRLLKVLLEDRRMEHNLFLGSEGIQLTSQAVEVTVYDRGASAAGSLENSVFHEMGDPAVEPFLIPGAALYAQGAIAYSRAASLDSILQSASCSSADHRCSFVIAE